MKKFLLTLFAALLSMNSLFAQNIAKQADGIYSGDLWVCLFEPAFDDETKSPGESVQIYVDGEGTVTLALYNFSFLGMSLGDIVLPKIPVMEKEGKIVFGENETVYLNFESFGIEASAHLNSETSFIDGKRLFADIDVVWTNGENTPIYVRFDGNWTAETGIKNIAENKTAAPESIYNLSGVRMSTAKGLCIKNGKKVFVK